MNYRIPCTDVLAGTKVLFYVATNETDTSLILIDAYSLKKMELHMNKKPLVYTLLLPFNEAGSYYYYFKIGNKFLDAEGTKEDAIIRPFTLNVYKENFLAEAVI